MPRSVWSLYAYQLIEPDEQLDLFACREARVHLVARQLRLGGLADRTLCGGLLPAKPRGQALEKAWLRDNRLCPACLATFEAQRQGLCSNWADG